MSDELLEKKELYVKNLFRLQPGMSVSEVGRRVEARFDEGIRRDKITALKKFVETRKKTQVSRAQVSRPGRRSSTPRPQARAQAELELLETKIGALVTEPLVMTMLAMGIRSLEFRIDPGLNLLVNWEQVLPARAGTLQLT